MAVDVDGTLLTGAHRVSARTADAVRRARDAGLSILLATSRGPVALWPVVDALGLAGLPVIAGQGAVTGRFAADGAFEVGERRSMNLADARIAVEVARSQGLAVSWYTPDAWLVSEVDPTIAREAEVVGVRPEAADLSSVADPPDKLMVIAPAGHPGLGAVAAALPPGLCAQTSNPTYLEITRRGVDKGSALGRLCSRAGVPREAVVAIGDGPNDIGMFAVAGRAVAMANAPAEVRAAAGEVTADNDHDGLALILDGLVAAAARTTPEG